MRNCGNKNCSQVNPQPLSSFRKRNDGGSQVRSQCKTCLNLKARSYYKKNNKQIKVKLNSNEDRKSKKKIYNSKTEIKQRARINSLKSLYGVTIEHYNEMLNSQNNCCAICLRPASEFKKRLHIDHCHETGKVRGLLCRGCNLALGIFKDNSSTLRKAAEYLESFI